MSDTDENEITLPDAFIEQKKVKRYFDFLDGLRAQVMGEVYSIGDTPMDEGWDDNANILVMLLNIDQHLTRAQEWLHHAQESEQKKQPQQGMWGGMPMPVQGDTPPEGHEDDNGHGSYL